MYCRSARSELTRLQTRRWIDLRARRRARTGVTMTTKQDPIAKQEPLRPRRLSKAVEERLLDMIRTEQLAPGDRIPSERELMGLFQVGRPAIREAMQNLERMGLVEIRHGGRPKVAAPSMNALVEQFDVSMRHLLTHSASSLDHLKDARVRLEVEMARIAAERRTVTDLRDLKALFSAHQAAKDDPSRFLELDGQFHKRIATISSNPIFEAVCSAIFAWMREFHVDLVRQPGLENLTLGEHQSIIDAIEAGDRDAAAAAVRAHLTRANELYHQSNLATV